MKSVVAFLLAFGMIAQTASLAEEPTETAPLPETSCIVCHRVFEGEPIAEPLKEFHLDVHAKAGLSCHDCHGGNPDLALADDIEAMSEEYGYKGAPSRLQIPEFCGTCHADADYMKRFDPQLRVDQLQEYRTSVHGRRNAEGDPTPAVCTDCHGVHGILPATAPASPVYPKNVAKTCAGCHADAAKMEPYGIPTDPYDDYMKSSHADHLFLGDDLSAPTCNDCHGNHGAVPPGVESVANVCGNCHAKQASLFRDSPKKEIFDSLDEPECIVCHGNHAITHPTIEHLHTGSGPSADGGRVLSSDPVRAAFPRLEPGATARASWALALRPLSASAPEELQHEVVISRNEGEELVVPLSLELDAPEWAPGPAMASSGDLEVTVTLVPLFGAPVHPGDVIRVEVQLRNPGVRPVEGITVTDRARRNYLPVAGSVCMQCHEEGDACDEATAAIYEKLLAVETHIRDAERLIAQAERAGMEVGPARFQLKASAISAAVETHALIHSFTPDKILEKADEALEAAVNARRTAADLLEDLQFRRKGLAVSLVLIALVLLGLYLKIRELDERRRAERARGSGSLP